MNSPMFKTLLDAYDYVMKEREVKQFDDYGPKTDHPHDPRNSLDDGEELYEATLTALETARGFIDKAIKVLNKEKYPDIVVTLAMDDAIVELGGVAPARVKL